MTGSRLCSRSSRWLEIKRPQLIVAVHAGHQLQQQAFAQVAGADARRIELLHHRQRLLRQRQFVGPGVGVDQVFQPALQVAVGIEVVDDPLGHLPRGSSRSHQPS